MTIDKTTDIVCPENGKTLQMPVCELLTKAHFGDGGQLLFHGTCEPEPTPFPVNEEGKPSIRWYAFDVTESLNYLKEDKFQRDKQKKRCLPTLYVYRIKKVIPNLLLFADPDVWNELGGQEQLFRNKICNIPMDESKKKEMKELAREVQAPTDEFAMAYNIEQYKIRKEGGEYTCHGWVRPNAINVLGENKLMTKAFELLLSHSNHEEFLELVDTRWVHDDMEIYGTVGKEYNDGVPSPGRKRKSIT